MPNQSSEHYQNFDKPIIFFDSICRLCNHTINLLLKFDRHEKFYFAPLQGETAKKLLAELPTIQPTIQKSTWNSIIVWNKGETYEKSVALLLMAKKIGGILWLVK
jgi:predicted DCC family thiol-disulfide oxidoreductase YuxK